MHPRQICKDVESMGAKLVLDEGDLFIEKPENVYSEIVDFIKGHKVRIIKYLNGSYTDKEHAVRQTIDKIVEFYRNDCPVDSKINNWLQNDEEALGMLLVLWRELYEAGWSYEEPIANYENGQTDKLSQEIFERAMSFFKGAK